MVVFACNACGESLKKNQVESHYYKQCRNCNVVSCLDCGKDFWGNDYEQHTKCISEAEKYSGKNFVPKPGSNKNEIKQQQWVQQVQDAVDKCTANPRLKSLLIRMKDQPNIPRKKNKFMNFMANGFNVRDPKLSSQVWDMLMTNTENTKQEPAPSQINTSKQPSEADKTEEAVNENPTTCNNVETNSDTTKTIASDLAKQSKREKKEERRKKAHKAEKKDKVKLADSSETVIENGIAEKTHKKKKRKHAEESIDENSTKKRKREEEQENMEDSAICSDNNIDEEIEEEPVKKKFKTKFDWSGVMCEVLRSKGPELKIKKLKKKVLAEYLSQGCSEKSEEKLWARFEKKLKRNPDIKVTGDRAKLKAGS